MKQNNIIYIASIFLITLISYLGINYSEQKEMNEQLMNRIAKLEESKIENTGLTADTITALITFYEEYEEVVAVYDNNVEIYNARITDLDTRLTETENAIIKVINYLTN